MNKTIKLGCLNQLKINRVSEPGLFLIAEDEEEILLPNAYITSVMEVGDILEVFVYTDSEDRLVCTTQKPYGMLHDYVALEVLDNVKFGSFVDWGLPKDLLVPKNRQKSTFNIGNTKVVQIIKDEKTNRLIGSEKFTLQKADNEFEKNTQVEVLVYGKSPLGFKVIVNNTFDGLIFHNEIFEKVDVGDTKRAYVKQIRDDGKIDISLQQLGQQRMQSNQDKVLEILEKNNGEVAFTYKSDASDIQDMFAMSKKTFKASLTKLIEEKKIILMENSIKLNI